MRLSALVLAAAAVAVSLPLPAATPGRDAPEIQRPVLPAQAVGSTHGLRNIPEACAGLQGVFTGDPAQPYRVTVVKGSTLCQARARLVDAVQAAPSAASGWTLNDVLRVPNAGCPSQQAVVRVWRHPAQATPPPLDAQGRSRIYLQESMQQAQANKLPPIPMYSATVEVEGSCGG
jgi:hypothetical protein